MEKIINQDLQRIRNNFSLLFIGILLLFSSKALAYKDQIIIEMPNSAKTIYDIRVHAFIRGLYEKNSVIDTTSNEWMSSSFENERKNFIEQYLVQSYISENGFDVKPTADQIKNVVQRIEKNFATPEAKKKAFSDLEITDTDLLQWVNNRFMMDNFISSSIQDRVVITDQKVEAHYQAWKGARFPDKPLEQISVKVREDLMRTLLEEEFGKWVDQEKRRQKMILKTVLST